MSYWSTKSDLEFMERFHADVKALWALEDKYEEAARRRNFRDLSDPPNVEDDSEYQKVREAVARGISRASHIAARLRVPVGLTSYPAPGVVRSSRRTCSRSSCETPHIGGSRARTSWTD